MNRRWFGVVLMVWASVASLLSYAPAANAVAGSYSWVNRDQMTVSGAPYANGTLAVTHISNTQFSVQGSVKLANGCQAFISINNLSSGTFDKASITVTNPPVAGNPVPVCSNNDIAGLNGDITIAHPELANGANNNPETPVQREINVRANPTASLPQADTTHSADSIKALIAAAAPATDTITLTNTKTNKVIKLTGKIDITVATAQLADPGTKSAGDQSSISYSVTFPNMDAGPYKVCSVVAANCVTFTKVDHNKSDIEIPGKNKSIDVAQPTPAPTNSGDDVTCDAGSGFTWIICGIITWAIDTIDWIRDNVILPFLVEPPLPVGAAASGYLPYNVWTSFRNVANVFFILIFFLTIFGTAIGYDNYTVKKVLPRLVAAAILIQFSWYIGAIIVDIGNVLGHGLFALMNSVLGTNHLTFDITSTGTKLTTIMSGVLLGVGVGAAASAGITAIVGLSFSTVIMLFISILVVFFTLILRKMLILLLIVVGPLAFVLWILPNTEKWFKEWLTTLIKLVLMYPAIVMLFEIGRLFAMVAEGANKTTVIGNTTGHVIAGVPNGFVPVIQLAAYAIPLFLVPMTFKMGGRAMGMAQAGLQKAKGLGDKQFGKNSNFAQERAARKEQNNLKKAENADTNTRFGRLKKAAYRNRSGNGGGFGGFGAGDQNKQRAYHAAVDKAAKEEAGLDAIKKNEKELGHESFNKRVEAERQAAQRSDADARSGREGSRRAEEEMGKPDQKNRFEAGADAEKLRLAGDQGQHDAAARAAGIKPVHAADARTAAARKDELKQQADRGAIHGTLAAGANTQQHLNDAYNAGSKTGRHDLNAQRGSNAAVSNVEAINPETNAALEAAAYQTTRKTEAASKMGRVKSLEVEAARPTTTQQVLKAAGRTAQAAAVAENVAVLTASAAAPIDISEQLAAGTRVEEKKLEAETQTIAGINEGAEIKEQELMNKHGITQTQARQQIVQAHGETARIAARQTYASETQSDIDTVAGHQAAIQNEVDDAYKTGRGYLSAAEADRNIVTDLAGEAGRAAYNKMTGGASKARGIGVGRQQQIKSVVDDAASNGHAITDEQAGNILDRESDTADFLAGTDEVASGVGQARGTARNYNEAVRKRASEKGISEDAARRELIGNSIRKATDEADIKTGQTIGDAQGTTETSEANLNREQHTLQEDYTPTTDIELADGKIIAAGQTLKKGTVLKTGTAMPAHSAITREQAQQRVTRQAIVSGQELGVRAQAAKAGSLSALTTAAQGSASAEQRLSSYTQAELDKLAGETVGINAQNAIINTPMQRDFQTSVDEGTSVDIDRKIEAKASEALDREITYVDADGATVPTRLKTIPHNDQGLARLKEIAIEAKNSGDTATMAAAMRTLGTSNVGRGYLNQLRVENFGGSPEREIMTPTGPVRVRDFNVKATPGEDAYLFDLGTKGVNMAGAPILQKTPLSAYNDVTAQDLATNDKAEVQRRCDFITSLGDEADKAQLAIDADDAEIAAGRPGMATADRAWIQDKATSYRATQDKYIRQLRDADTDAMDPNSPFKGSYSGDKREFVATLLARHPAPPTP